MFETREPSIDALRHAPVKFRYTEPKVHRVFVDRFTAGAILAIYKVANAENKAKIERMVAGTPAQFQRVASIAFKLVK